MNLHTELDQLSLNVTDGFSPRENTGDNRLAASIEAALQSLDNDLTELRERFQRVEKKIESNYKICCVSATSGSCCICSATPIVIAGIFTQTLSLWMTGMGICFVGIPLAMYPKHACWKNDRLEAKKNRIDDKIKYLVFKQLYIKSAEFKKFCLCKKIINAAEVLNSPDFDAYLKIYMENHQIQKRLQKKKKTLEKEFDPLLGNNQTTLP